MKLCIFSDSHGRADLVKKLPAADAYLFCGDGLGDLEGLPGPVYAVAGTCDWTAREPDKHARRMKENHAVIFEGYRPEEGRA